MACSNMSGKFLDCNWAYNLFIFAIFTIYFLQMSRVLTSWQAEHSGSMLYLVAEFKSCRRSETTAVVNRSNPQQGRPSIYHLTWYKKLSKQVNTPRLCIVIWYSCGCIVKTSYHAMGKVRLLLWQLSYWWSRIHYTEVAVSFLLKNL